MRIVLGLPELTTDPFTRLGVSAAVVLAVLGSAYLIRRVRGRLKERVRPVALDLVASLIVATVVIAGTLGIAELWGQTDVLLNELGFLRIDRRGPEVTMTVVVLIAAQVFSGIARRLFDNLAVEEGALSPHQREIGVRLSQMVVWAIGLIVVLGVWNVDLSGILVGAGFLGIVLGLAAQKTIGSVVAGLVLMFSRPFEVGDWVVLDRHEGTVTDITLMSTRILVNNGERVIVPNDRVTGEIVVNRTTEGRFRVDAEVGIDYDDDVGTAVSVAESSARTVVEQERGALEEPAPSVVAQSFDESAVALTARVWVRAPDEGAVTRVRHALIEQLKADFDEAGLTIPYPQRELSARDGTLDGAPPITSTSGPESSGTG